MSVRPVYLTGTLKYRFPGDAGHRHCNRDSCLFPFFDPFLYQVEVQSGWRPVRDVRLCFVCLQHTSFMLSLIKLLSYFLLWVALKLCPSSLFSCLFLGGVGGGARG